MTFAETPDAFATSALYGVVVEFDVAVGLGTVETSDGSSYPFHCIEIADGSREIAVGATVSFESLAKLGRYEAAAISMR